MANLEYFDGSTIASGLAMSPSLLEGSTANEMIVRMRVSVDLLSFLLTEHWIPVLSAFLTNMRVRAVLSSQKSLLLSLVLSSALIFC